MTAGQSGKEALGGCLLLVLLLGIVIGLVTPYWGVTALSLTALLSLVILLGGRQERLHPARYPIWFYLAFTLIFSVCACLSLGTGGEAAAERDVTSTYVAFCLGFGSLAALGYTIRRWLNRRRLQEGHPRRHGVPWTVMTPGEDLVASILNGDRMRLQAVGNSGLPRWPISAAILRAAGELLELRLSGPIAQRAGVAAGAVEFLVEEVNDVAQILGSVADRVAAAAAQNLPAERLRDALDRETHKIESITASVVDVRDKLGALTLMGGDNEQVQEIVVRLHRLGELADELTRLQAGA